MGNGPHYRDFLFDHENNRHLAYYSAVGRIVVAWSMLESQFDVCIWLMYESLGGKTLVKEPPRALTRKVDFWKECFRKLPNLQSHKDAAYEFGDQLSSAAGDRNRMLHTNWGNMFSADKFEQVTGSGFKSDASGYTHYNSTMTLEGLGDLLQCIADLQTRMLPFTFFLVEQQPNRPKVDQPAPRT